ncbi:hypothetical protein TWF694_004986 [Orbilia ellipsospora]|uniref:Uncharacterized protein n=1 Tax=Orbilia ellipsospora TaxID=2528407 RepID=A0AAV9WUA9_9PEZI
MPNTPLPAPVHFIQNVHYLAVGSKVRVLGCIQDYDVASGTVVLHHRPTAISVPPPQILDRQNRQRKRRKIAVSPPRDSTRDNTKARPENKPRPAARDKDKIKVMGKGKGKAVVKSNDTAHRSTTNGITTAATTIAIPIPAQPRPNYTLHVKVDMMLHSPDGEKDVTASLPPIVEGRWVTVIGYKLPDGALEGIAMIEVDKGLDLEGYERAVAGMVAVREEVERKVFEGTAKGCAVKEGEWGY